MPSKSQRRRPATPVRQPAPGELDETRPHSITEVAGRMITESASPAMAQLNYACLLVPRFTAHYMTGDLADHISEWMPNICIAFGLAAGIPGCAARIFAMGGQCNAEHVAGLLDAHYASANFGKNLSRIPAFET